MKNYTVTQIKALMTEFYQNHPSKGQWDEYTGNDLVSFQMDQIIEFVHWVESGEYGGELKEFNGESGLDAIYRERDEAWQLYQERELARIQETPFVSKYSKIK